MDTTRGTALIVGATGVVGNAALHQFLDDGWDVIAASDARHTSPTARRSDTSPSTSPAQTTAAAAASQLAAVTHVVYAALYEKPGLIVGLERPRPDGDQRHDAAQPVRRARRGEGAGPTRQRAAGHQGVRGACHDDADPGQGTSAARRASELLLAAGGLPRASAPHANGFGLTIWRPQFIFGGPIGAAMNLVPVIGAYAAIRTFEGLPFSFPGGASYVAEAADARLIASAMALGGRQIRPPGTRPTTSPMATASSGATCGRPWPTISAPRSVTRSRCCSPRGSRRSRASGTRSPACTTSSPFRCWTTSGSRASTADFAFAYGSDGRNNAPAFVSTVKLRQAGFCEAYDTEDSFAYWFDDLRARRLLPGR